MKIINYFKPNCLEACCHTAFIQSIECIPIVGAMLSIIRSALGPRNVCIFFVSCPEYARHHLAHSNILKACVLILVRVISCNPLVALVRKILKYQ